MDIRKLNAAQLSQLAKKIEKRQESLNTSKVDEARKAIGALLKKFGLDISDVYPSASAAGRRGRKAAGKDGEAAKGRRRNTWIKKGMKAKYANPADPSETWVGIGKRPFWFRDAIKSGATAESMLIK